MKVNIRLKSLLPALASVALIAAAPAKPADHHPAPVVIDACTAKLPKSPAITTKLDSNHHVSQFHSQSISIGNGLTIAFTNTAKVAAREINFSFGTERRTILTKRDAGTFAPHVKITHRFPFPHDVSVIGIGSATCRVTKVVFADGSTWP